MQNSNAKINLAEKFGLIKQPWSPRIIAELNGQHVKIALFDGDFDWHHHDQEDELFLVIEGRLQMHLRDGVIELNEGELCVVPRGVEHKPCAPEGARVLMFEPATTLNTGEERSERTVDSPEWI